jgi:hypothetical protein
MMAQSLDDRPASYPELISLIDDLAPTFFEESSPGGSSATTAALATPRQPANSANTDTNATGSKTESGFEGVQPTAERPTNRRQLLMAGVVGLAVVAGGAWWFTQAGKQTPPPRPSKIKMKDLGPSVRLFNGSNIAGWQQRSGNWIVPPGAPTLEGTDGLLVKTLFQKGDGQPKPIELFRLIVLVDCAEAESAEIQFGFELNDQRNGPRYAIQFTKEGISIGERSSDKADFQQFGNKPPASITGEVAAIIEQQPSGWFVSINERPLADLPRRPNGELPEIRLATKGGPARFSEITLTELAPAD